MSPSYRIAAALLCAALSPVAAGAAEEPAAAARAAVATTSSASRPQSPAPVREWKAREALQPSASRGGSSGARGAKIGAMLGALTATAVVAIGAKAYGENEGGGFCTPCFAGWGIWAIPVGALGGAAIGYGIAKAGSPQYASPVPRTFVAPLVGRRAGGIVMTVRY